MAWRYSNNGNRMYLKKSGTGNYPVIGEFGEENFDNTKLDIVGI